jgi:GxxExxY protein
MDEIRDELTGRILGAAIEVHRLLGPGLLESVYETCLCHEFSVREIAYQRQVRLPIVYKELKLEQMLVIDILVDQQVILELKSVHKIEPIHEAQLLTYLKLSNIRRGLLINFNVNLLKNGIKRMVL